MERLTVTVNRKQKKVLMDLIDELELDVLVEPTSNPDSLKSNAKSSLEDAVKACFGMWKDRDEGLTDLRTRAWGNRGV